MRAERPVSGACRPHKSTPNYPIWSTTLAVVTQGKTIFDTPTYINLYVQIHTDRVWCHGMIKGVLKENLFTENVYPRIKEINFIFDRFT